MSTQTTMSWSEALGKLNDLRSQTEAVIEERESRLKEVVAEYDGKIHGLTTQIRDLADVIDHGNGHGNGVAQAPPAKRRGRPKNVSGEPPKRRGRPKGSKNVAKNVSGEPPKRRGRPKGSKNVVKDASEPPKRRGRPKGSKNVVKDASEPPKRRGRPKGSKNAPKIVSGEPPKRRGGRPKGSKNAPKIVSGEPPKRRGGRPKGSKNTAKNVSGDTDVKMTCGRAVWDILDRKPSEWNSLLSNLPNGVSGLNILDIKKIVGKEKKWKSSSDDPSQQIQNALLKLRAEGKVGRDEEKRYYIVQGAEFDGPKLDDHGKPVAE